MNPAVPPALARLQAVLAGHGTLALAVSGGVDSMTLAYIACRSNPSTEVFHALSAAVPAQASARVRAYAAQHGWRLHLVDAGEFSDPAYRANPGNRCYFCKSNLYRSLHAHTPLVVAAGTNLDDLQDYRPGLQAASEQQVVHPLVEAGIDKKGVRELAAFFALHDLKELPASPCLSSRITTGIAIDAELLVLIDRSETALRQLLKLQGSGADLRCRIRSDGIAIETATEPASELLTLMRTTVGAIFADTPFTHYAANLSIEAYRRGSAFIRVAT